MYFPNRDGPTQGWQMIEPKSHQTKSGMHVELDIGTAVSDQRAQQRRGEVQGCRVQHWPGVSAEADLRESPDLSLEHAQVNGDSGRSRLSLTW